MSIGQSRLSLPAAQKLGLLSLIPVLCTISLLISQHANTEHGPIEPTNSVVEAQLDSQLTAAAVSALQDREGTIIVIDPQTGRVITALNDAMAFEKAFAPGSTLKPFAALAAMRSGVINSGSRYLCREKYAHRDFQIACSHPQHLPPLNASEAIAYSCNYYFGKLGEQIDGRELSALLSSFGFGAKTEINVEREIAGKLIRAGWQAEGALGEVDYVEVTPIQMLVAYSALVNGGNLFIPRRAEAESFKAEVRSNFQLTSDEREVIFDGLRDAIRFGTAKGSGLNSLPLFILGKTGTSKPTGGFRTQGWFVGFASEPGDKSVNPKLGVLVFLKNANGATAAEVSRRIFEEYAVAEKSGSSESIGVVVVDRRNTSLPSSIGSSQTLRIHLAGEDVTREMSVEDYVLGVLAAEGSLETRVEALKALAVASRSYAMKNLGRHSNESFDFCNTTHCQLFSVGAPSDLVRSAVFATQGEVLRDGEGAIIEAYFSASCGGETADIAKLWNTRPQSYLRRIKDPYCSTMPHSHWTDSISENDLLRALNSDPRTRVGNHLETVIVLRHDETGRAERIKLIGERQQTVSGWNFKIIVGRAFGWNFLKSSRFIISRSGSSFVFRGSGFGHGLGLCQEGAHVMAERGFSYKQILSKYFPGTSVGKNRKAYEADLLWSTSIGTRPIIPELSHFEPDYRHASSEHFRISYPASMGKGDAEYLLQLLETIRSDLLRRPALPRVPRLPVIQVFLNQTTGDFVGRTGQPWWTAGASSSDGIELQPVALLKKRGILETTLRHELVHKIVESLGNGRVPRWLTEGLALNLAGEGPMISRYHPKQRIPINELEKKLASPGNSDEMRQLYAAAYGEVRSLIKSQGEAAVWHLVVRAER